MRAFIFPRTDKISIIAPYEKLNYVILILFGECNFLKIYPKIQFGFKSLKWCRVPGSFVQWTEDLTESLL